MASGALRSTVVAWFAGEGPGRDVSFPILGIVKYSVAGKRRFEDVRAAAVPPASQGASKLDSDVANSWVLPSDPTAARVARGHVFDACRGVHPAKVDVASLLASELVANAVLHGSGTVQLVVARNGDGIRVEVEDENPDPPVVVALRSLPEHGMGMRLVVAMADRWGAAPRGDGHPGKRVWFELV